MKTIYKPKGKAGEYAKYAVNFYGGCSNGCEYCYLKRGLLSHALGGDKPVLLKKFKDEETAAKAFYKDVDNNLEELRQHGLFFTFTSDPCLPETVALNCACIEYAAAFGVPCKVLTKRADFADLYIKGYPDYLRKYIAVGFTLTGCDDMESNASPNKERIEAMRKLHDAGFKTWVSFEPIIDPSKTFNLVYECEGICDLMKFGLRSGVKKDYYNVFMLDNLYVNLIGFSERTGIKIYIKDSFMERLGLDREELAAHGFVGADYNMFEV